MNRPQAVPRAPLAHPSIAKRAWCRMLNTCMAGAGGGLGFFGDRLSGGGIPPVEAEERAQSAQRMLSHAGEPLAVVGRTALPGRSTVLALEEQILATRRNVS